MNARVNQVQVLLFFMLSCLAGHGVKEEESQTVVVLLNLLISSAANVFGIRKFPDALDFHLQYSYNQF